MKKYIPILFLASLLLSGCSIDWSDKKDLFEKKQECAKYFEDIIKFGEGGYINELSLNEIFYSRILNSCLFTVKDDNLYSIYDFLGKKEIFSITGPIKKCGGISNVFTEDFNKCSEALDTEYEAKISELKGE